MQENTIPWIIKVVPAVVGAILALVLSGDIDKNGKIQISLGVIGKFLFSVSVSLYGLCCTNLSVKAFSAI